MLYTINKDILGYIVALGIAPDDFGVNITTFAPGRCQKHGQAIALLGLDDLILDHILEKRDASLR